MRPILVLALFFVCETGVGLAQTAAPAAVPAPIATPMGEAGLQIIDCSLTYNEVSKTASILHVDFINKNALPVTHIRFRVATAYTHFAVMDIGTFQPNLRIHHDLNPPAAQLTPIHGWTGISSGMGCYVDAYTLSDGYTWISDSLQKELNQRQ